MVELPVPEPKWVQNLSLLDCGRFCLSPKFSVYESDRTRTQMGSSPLSIKNSARTHVRVPKIAFIRLHDLGMGLGSVSVLDLRTARQSDMCLIARCVLSAWLPFEDACKAGNSSSGLVKFIYFDCCTFDAHVFIEGLGFRITSRH